jgi:hypothetical protein
LIDTVTELLPFMQYINIEAVHLCFLTVVTMGNCQEFSQRGQGSQFPRGATRNVSYKPISKLLKNIFTHSPRVFRRGV